MESKSRWRKLKYLISRLDEEVVVNIYVGNLSSEITEDDLRQAFAAFGQVRFVNIVRDGASGESRGFGFVSMPSMSEAQEAIAEMNGKDLKGQAVKVEKGRMRTPRRGGGASEGGGRGKRTRRGGFGGGGRDRRRY